jgi:cell shape-determining protein MreC
MFSVILLVIIAIAFGFFSTQNSIPIPVTFGDLVVSDVPLYIVLGVTLLIGLLFSWVISLANSMLFSMNLRKKDHTITDVTKDNEKLNQRLIDLEMENTRLRAELNKEV